MYRVMNIPILRRAPWLVYFLLFSVAVGLTIMCVRLQLGDDVLAIVCASVTVGLILATALCVYISVRRGQQNEPPPGRKKKRRITVSLKAHLFGQDDQKEDEKPDAELTCHICLLDLEKGERVVELECGHVFHVECATNWIQRVAVCPACRYNLPTKIVSRSTSGSNSPANNV
jgi:hypothetical protein